MLNYANFHKVSSENSNERVKWLILRVHCVKLGLICLQDDFNWINIKLYSDVNKFFLASIILTSAD